MTDSSLLMPGADDAYRRSREGLREAEIDLRDRIETVAAMRRSLPPGPVVPDYTFVENGKRVRLSELFADDKPHLILYHLMYWAADDDFCPMCSLWIDGFNGIAPHVTQRANFAVASRAPFDKLKAWGERRGWDRLRLLSDDGAAFARDIDAEDDAGNLIPRSLSSRKTATACVTCIPRTRCSRTASAGSICFLRFGTSSISCPRAARNGIRPTTPSKPRCTHSRGFVHRTPQTRL